MDQGVRFEIDGQTVASVHREFLNKGKYCYSCGARGAGNNIDTKAEAAYLCAMTIRDALKGWNISVKFASVTPPH